MKPRELSGEALLVYGDTLAAAGHAQGSLINLQVARHRSPFARRAQSQKQQEVELCTERRAELLGPLASIPRVEVAWALGFVSQLWLPLRDESTVDALAEALALPAFARLERLTLTGDASDLSCLGGTGLRHLALDGVSDWSALLETLPPIRSLSLRGDATLDLDGMRLPELELLRLNVPVENLDSLKAPRLRVLRLSEFVEAAAIPPLALLHLEGYLSDETGELAARRVIHEWQHGGDEELPGVISRSGRGRYGERAFVLSTAPLERCRQLASTLDADNLTASIATVQLGWERFSAIELRAENATDGSLLRQTSQALARDGHRTVEFAVSPSNVECIAWAISPSEPDRVRPLVMGPANEQLMLWRTALDRALAIDPGDALDELLLELDAATPVVLGEPPVEGTEWPLISTFRPREPDWAFDYDYEDELDEPVSPDSGFDPTDFRDTSAPVNWWKTPGAEEALEPGLDEAVAETEASDDPEEAPEPRAEGWGEILEQSPVDLESDGEERNPEFGLEPDEFDPDSVPATVLTDGVDQVECEICEARVLTLKPCFSCGRRVCAACTVGAPRADGEVKCTACPDFSPSPPVEERVGVRSEPADADEED